MEFNIKGLFQHLTDAVMEYGPILIGAIIVWIIGSMIIKKIVALFNKFLDKKNTDTSLRPFLKSLVSTLLKIMLIISVLGMLGVEMTSFIALLGAVGLAIGMALSGTLQNFAGGVMILAFKPFKIGDFIEAQGHKGNVKEIQIFNTILTDLDNKTIILPNGSLSTSSIINYSTEPIRRVDFTFGIAYGDHVEKAREVLNAVINQDERILKDPESFTGLAELGDSSVNLTTRVWVNNDDYWDVFFDMNEKVYNAFNKEGINIPFPQMDVHLHKQE